MVKSSQNLILINANIITLDPISPQESWVAIENHKIVAVGYGKEWKKLKNKNTHIIDCRGKTVLPGFIDAHMHLVSYAKSFITLDLNPGKKVLSIADIQTLINNHSAKNPSCKWILGRGYNEFYLAEKRHPNRWDLDKAAPDKPVKLTHRSGHAHVLNSLANQIIRLYAWANFMRNQHAIFSLKNSSQSLARMFFCLRLPLKI